MMRRLKDRFRMVSLALVLAMAMPLWAPTPAMAAGTYVGGPDNDPPIYGLNDHTPMAIHYTASGLLPDTTYQVKVRFTVSTEPSGDTNRGWTYNPTTGKWAQERDAWGTFPTVTTDASGTIGINAFNRDAAWVYAKFGDEQKSGNYYVMVSLNYSGASGTSNPTTPTPITILDAKTQGAWVHNALATGIAAGKRAEVTSPDVTTTVFALLKTESNALDDDANGTLDDENQGPAGLNGDYRMGVPASTTVDVFLNRQKKFNNIVTGQPDTEVALGAADMTPPSAPASLTATRVDRNIAVAWGQATDNHSVAAYRVYRWEQPVGNQSFTPVHRLVSTTSERSYTDTATPDNDSVVIGYDVRAVDTSGNIGPRRSATVLWDDEAPTFSGLTVPKFASDQATTLRVKISWAGTDTAPGAVAAYDVQYKRGATDTWKTWKAGTPATSAYFTPKAGYTYYFRARAIDGAGNTSAYSGEKSMMTPRSQGVMSFSSGWATKYYAGYWKGSVKYTKRRGKSATFKYTGKDVYLIVTKAPTRGKMKVYVNGTYVKTIDTKSATFKPRQAVLVKSYSTSKTRTVKIVNSATSGRPRIDLDGFAYRR